VGLDDKLRDVNEELQVLAVKEATYRETLEKLRKRVVREWKNVSRDVRSGVSFDSFLVRDGNGDVGRYSGKGIGLCFVQ